MKPPPLLIVSLLALLTLSSCGFVARKVAPATTRGARDLGIGVLAEKVSDGIETGEVQEGAKKLLHGTGKVLRFVGNGLREFSEGVQKGLEQSRERQTARRYDLRPTNPIQVRPVMFEQR